ncbi:MAG: hypothetical protein M0006_00690 [Magnetospirillum sp.]|nr:hypothetical protein [Magnetospirillum sp.]
MTLDFFGPNGTSCRCACAATVETAPQAPPTWGLGDSRTAVEMAALIVEMFREGTLSETQLLAFGSLREIGHLLDGATRPALAAAE